MFLSYSPPISSPPSLTALLPETATEIAMPPIPTKPSAAKPTRAPAAAAPAARPPVRPAAAPAKPVSPVKPKPVMQASARNKPLGKPLGKTDTGADAAAEVRRLKQELARAEATMQSSSRTNSGGGGVFRLLAGTHTYSEGKNEDGTPDKATRKTISPGETFETDLDMVEMDGPQRWVKVSGSRTRRPSREERPASMPGTEQATDLSDTEFDADGARRASTKKYLESEHDTESEAAALAEGDESQHAEIEGEEGEDGDDDGTDEAETGTDADGLEDLSIADLKATATAEGAVLPGRANKQQAIDAIRARRSEQEEASE